MRAGTRDVVDRLRSDARVWVDESDTVMCSRCGAVSYRDYADKVESWCIRLAANTYGLLLEGV